MYTLRGLKGHNSWQATSLALETEGDNKEPFKRLVEEGFQSTKRTRDGEEIKSPFRCRAGGHSFNKQVCHAQKQEGPLEKKAGLEVGKITEGASLKKIEEDGGTKMLLVSSTESPRTCRLCHHDDSLSVTIISFL